VGASPRPLPGEDPIRRRRADADGDATIFGSIDGGEPTEGRGGRACPAPQAIGRSPATGSAGRLPAHHVVALAVMAMALIAPGGER
jgi:hypothetical protein